MERAQGGEKRKKKKEGRTGGRVCRGVGDRSEEEKKEMGRRRRWIERKEK